MQAVILEARNRWGIAHEWSWGHVTWSLQIMSDDWSYYRGRMWLCAAPLLCQTEGRAECQACGGVVPSIAPWHRVYQSCVCEPDCSTASWHWCAHCSFHYDCLRSAAARIKRARERHAGNQEVRHQRLQNKCSSEWPPNEVCIRAKCLALNKNIIYRRNVKMSRNCIKNITPF